MGANGGSNSNPNPVNKRRKLMLLAGLIEHPEEGLILYETGCADDVETVCLSLIRSSRQLAQGQLADTPPCLTGMGTCGNRHVPKNGV